jgi:hypothetical protein
LRALGVIGKIVAAGGPGDHPISDVLEWELSAYSEDADEMIRRLSKLLTRNELYDFWEVELGWGCEPDKALASLALKLHWAEKRAQQSGWEVY